MALQKGRKTLWKKEKLLVMSNFSFSPSVFKRLVLQTCKNQGLFGKGLTLYHAVTTFNNLQKQHFLLFPQCFLPFSKQVSIFQSHLFCGLQMLSMWTSPRFCCLVNPFQHNKIMNQTKLKAFADNKLNVTKMIISVFD